ncbi:MAG TPA: acetyl-CoA carboxylase biotin carboxyl carrier protein [Pirellulales bacterium]|jgi:acetyl-CoA carboxylase biotin carboxyl carrier protein|nr:acetyl-CoA carboxylase biotin carboxyl carrier protein [Pirellulales bacterium]
MSNAGSNPNDIFDVKKVRRFVDLMIERDLAEIDLRQGEQRIRIRRGSEPVVTGGEYRPAPAAAAPVAPTAAKPAEEDKNVVLIKSPTIGTFYVAANPESPAFVKVGDHIGPDSTVCIIEAMKVFNEVPAGTSGQIAACLVENGESVEFGQPLFKVTLTK